MKSTIQLILKHFFVITTCVLLVTSVSNILAGTETFPREYPLYVLLTGALTALPTALFYFKTEPTKKQFIVRLILHFVVIETIVLTEGFFFSWYSGLGEAIILFLIILLIYLIVWRATIKDEKKTAERINAVLSKMNDNEND